MSAGVKHRHIGVGGEMKHRHPLDPLDLDHNATMYPVRVRKMTAKVWRVITLGSHARFVLGTPDKLEKP